MSLKGQICTRGVWDESVPGIVFDKNGVSNYAKLFDRLVESYPRGETGKINWETIVKGIKTAGKNNKYDCIIGVSGGTDSSFLLHLAKEHGLSPLAVNLDNGWNSDIAVKNIRKMTRALNIDLETYVINYEEIKDLLRSYMKAGLPWIDMPTDLAIKAVLYKIANREKIKFILRGNDFRSEGTQPREWTYGDGKQLNYIHKKFGSVPNLHSFPNYNLSDLLYFSLIKGIKSIYPYYYLDYQKKEAQSFLQNKYNWEYYGGHHFENIFTRFAISYWLYEKFAIDKRKISLSAQVLSGEIIREEAIDILSSKPYADSEKKMMMEYILKKLDFNEEEFNAIMNLPPKSFYDYPSNYKMIDGMNYFSKAFFKRIFIHKPQSLFQAEMRKKNS
jgi:N-acetyl sugar amidotransferase